MRKLQEIFLNDRFILFLILLNSGIIFAQGFENSLKTNEFLNIIDNFVTLLFIVELSIKLKHFGIKNFIKSSWNIFDATLILIAIPSLFHWLFNSNPTQLDYILVLRIARIFKFFRFIRFFPNINQLINGIKRALKASVIVLLGFFVYIFIISILACFFYRNIAPDYFGDPLISIYTIFKVFTVEGWYEIPDFISQNASPLIGTFTKIFFVTILITGGIFGLSLVNSIFVDAMVSDNNEELEKKVESLEQKIDFLINKTLNN